MPTSMQAPARHGRVHETKSSEFDDVAQPEPSSYFRWKPWLDRPLAAILLFPCAIIIAVLVVIVRLTSPGPAIFRQLRVGRGGLPFTMYKIRTMRQDAEEGTGAVWSQQGDARVTTVGRILRKLHLDEFPQLINVLKGEMSLIGPRPERPEFTQQLATKLPGYLERLAVLPGITGLAQINLPPDSDLESVRRKLYLDVRYIEEANLWLDLRMSMCTATRLIGVPGDAAMRFFRLRRTIPMHDVISHAASVSHGKSSGAHNSNGRPALHRSNGNGHAHSSNQSIGVAEISTAVADR